MLALDALLHKWMVALDPAIKTLTFVDNWEVVMNSPQVVEAAFGRMCSFVQMLDLELDGAKTFFWSTSALHRASLRDEGRNVRLDAKDLGAHVVFSRQLANRFLAKRVADLDSFWPLFEAAHGKHRLKIQVLLASAWPRAFHACSAVVIGRRILDRVRSLCMKSLGFQKPGANTWLHFGLEGEGVDPLQWIITSTLKDSCADHRLLECGSPCRDPFACSGGSVSDILLQRIHMLGWRVSEGWEIHDSIGSFLLQKVHRQALLFRINWAWTFVIHRHVQHRESLVAFDQVDRELTRADLFGLDDYSVGILSRHLNGSSFANDVTWKWSADGSDCCRLCGACDSVFHRLWCCPAADDLRQAVDPEVLRYHECFPLVLSVHGWTLKSPYCMV